MCFAKWQNFPLNIKSYKKGKKNTFFKKLSFFPITAHRYIKKFVWLSN